MKKTSLLGLVCFGALGVFLSTDYASASSTRQQILDLQAALKKADSSCDGKIPVVALDVVKDNQKVRPLAAKITHLLSETRGDNRTKFFTWPTGQAHDAAIHLLEKVAGNAQQSISTNDPQTRGLTQGVAGGQGVNLQRTLESPSADTTEAARELEAFREQKKEEEAKSAKINEDLRKLCSIKTNELTQAEKKHLRRLAMSAPAGSVGAAVASTGEVESPAMPLAGMPHLAAFFKDDTELGAALGIRAEDAGPNLARLKKLTKN